MFCRRHAKFLVPLVPRRVQLVPRRAHQLPNYRTCTCHGKENLRRSRRTDAGDGREGPKASGRPFWKAFGRGDAQAKARQGRTDDQSGRPSAREHKPRWAGRARPSTRSPIRARAQKHECMGQTEHGRRKGGGIPRGTTGTKGKRAERAARETRGTRGARHARRAAKRPACLPWPHAW